MQKSSPNNQLFRRVFWIVLDGVGAGELPDANVYGDTGSNTLGNLAKAFQEKMKRPLHLPNMAAMGLGNITPMEGVQTKTPGQGEGAFGKAVERSQGKDTTSGHWEMAGLVLEKPFTVYKSFPEEVVSRWVKENQLPGVLYNRAASGTTIIDQLGEEHIRTGKPILYTSADSVWQVAAHEEHFGLERLYSICKSARKICDELQVGRVIARPFIGNPAEGAPFQRTYNRKDYAQKPWADTYLDLLCQAGIKTLGIGKISSIYATQGIQSNLDTHGNEEGIEVLIEQTKTASDGLVFCNLIDFDMLYGHRRDVQGFGEALERFDIALPEIKKNLKADDLFLVSADHGNDPTFAGTDHTREYIPLLAYTPAQTAPGPVALGTRTSFCDVGATVVHALLGKESLSSQLSGKSFLDVLGVQAKGNPS